MVFRYLELASQCESSKPIFTTWLVHVYETINSYCLREPDMYFHSRAFICVSFCSRQNRHQINQIQMNSTESSLERLRRFLNFSKNTTLLQSTPEIARSLQQKFLKQSKNRFPPTV